MVVLVSVGSVEGSVDLSVVTTVALVPLVVDESTEVSWVVLALVSVDTVLLSVVVVLSDVAVSVVASLGLVSEMTSSTLIVEAVVSDSVLDLPLTDASWLVWVSVVGSEVVSVRDSLVTTSAATILPTG